MWAKPAVSFCLFSSVSQHNDDYNTIFDWKWKRRWLCALDSNLGPQDGRRRQIHWALTVPLIVLHWGCCIHIKRSYWRQCPSTCFGKKLNGYLVNGKILYLPIHCANFHFCKRPKLSKPFGHLVVHCLEHEILLDNYLLLKGQRGK